MSVGVSIAIAVGIVVIVAPYAIRKGNSRYANVNLGEVEYSVGTGDLFLVQAGSIAATTTSPICEKLSASSTWFGMVRRLCIS
ncbi:MAG: hypothetical protein Q9P01_12365 [Anaerolineae bacterium]|nr:hypothetical protein [Anaerolineae bacterium]